MSPSAKAAVATKSPVNTAARQTPAAYLNPNFSGMKTEDLVKWQPPSQPFPEPPPAPPSTFTDTITEPPAGVRPLVLRKAAAESRELPAVAERPIDKTLTPEVPQNQSEHPVGRDEVSPPRSAPTEDRDLPEWMQGAGPDVVAASAGLALSPEHLPGLKSLGDAYPLLGAFFAAVLDPLFEAFPEKVKRVSSAIAQERLTNPHASLRDLIRVAAERPFSEAEAGAHLPAVSRLEQEIAVDEERVTSAHQRLNKDLERAIREESNAPREVQTQVEVNGKPQALEETDAMSNLTSAQSLDQLRALSRAGNAVEHLNGNELSGQREQTAWRESQFEVEVGWSSDHRREDPRRRAPRASCREKVERRELEKRRNPSLPYLPWFHT